MIRRLGTRVSDWHPINRRISIGVIFGALRKGHVAPDDPTVSKRSVGVITGGMIREHVKRVEAKPSAPDDPKEYRSNALE
jgi:hypothetical protein